MSNKSRRRSGEPTYHPDVREVIGDDRPFTFTVDGTLYTLPPASDGSDNVSAGAVIDAVTGDERLAGIRLAVATLTACNASPKAIAALRSLPMKKFLAITEEWMKRSGGGSGESSR